MIITKLNLDNLGEVSELSIEIKEDNSKIDLIEMLKYLDRSKCNNWLYINWDKHNYNKNLLEVL